MRRSLKDIVYGTLYFTMMAVFFVVNIPAKFAVKTAHVEKIVKRNCVHD